MTEIEDIVMLLRHETGDPGEINLDTTLQDDLGVYGDDMSEVLDEYAEQFTVDMSSYLWYFHTGEEGWSFGGNFFKPPDERVTQIPITVEMLRDFAKSGSWSVQYPEHKLPKYRIDIVINQVFALIVFVILVVIGLEKWFGIILL